jgi:cell division protein FtsZ
LAISSPLLEASIDGAHGVLLSISGGSDLGLFEINEAARLVQEAAHPEANIIFGTVIDDALGDEVRVTVIAAGFDGGNPTPRQDARALGQVQPGRGTSPGGDHGHPAGSRPVRWHAAAYQSGSSSETAARGRPVGATRLLSSCLRSRCPRGRRPSTTATTSTSPTSSSSPRPGVHGCG